MHQSAAIVAEDSYSNDLYGGTTISEIKQWVVCVKEEHGEINRFNIIRAFHDFIHSPELSELPIPGLCVICGRSYGYYPIQDGDGICTSQVRKLFVVDEGRFITQPDIIQRIGIETSSGSKFFVTYQGDFSIKVIQFQPRAPPGAFLKKGFTR